jgi:serine protease AprX
MKPTSTLLLPIFFAGALLAGNGKVANDLAKLNPTSTVNVIVRFKKAPTNANHQKIRGKGGVRRKDLRLVKGALYSMRASALEELAADPDVAYISPDRPLKAAMDIAEATVKANNIASQYGWDGTGVGVAVIDSGVTSHDDLKAFENNTLGNSRIVYSMDFVGDGNNDL